MFKKIKNKEENNDFPYENKYNFQKLTPTTLEDLKIYKDAFEFIFNNEDIKNIGITGAYSAGKSSVIETYKSLNPDLKFLNISLAYFQETNYEQIVEEQNNYEKPDKDEIKQGDEVRKGSSDAQNISIDEKVLEGKILNQLIHQINRKDIQQTNFRVKRHYSDSKLFFLGALITVLILILTFITKFFKWNGYVNSLKDGNIKNSLLVTTSPLMLIFTSAAAMIILTCMIYILLKAQINHSLFKKLSIQGNSFEILGQSNESYFDKYLNEVLYLFENCGADIIVFEDIDRYNSNQIFQRLREINMLVNNRKKLKNIKTNTPMRFFYLLRDDIFVNKDRTKFFDFIIPVVPVIDGSNSINKFISFFKAGNVFHHFKEQFLQEISLYIDDMRILKNIYNEYIVYENQIKTTEQKADKLLAMVIYKNIFPRDFSDLQLNSGFVYTLFNKKEFFISDEKKTLEKKLSDLEVAEKEILQSLEEVDHLYEYKRDFISPNYGTSYQKKLDLLTKEKNERKRIVQIKKDYENDELKKKIEEVKIELSKLDQKKLYEIINKENRDKIFKVVYENELGQTFAFEEIKGSNYFPLIKYLIKKGYIDETYPDYMSFFYHDSISSSDKIFIRNVIDGERELFSFEINNPDKVALRLDKNYFDNDEVLNIYLVNFLLNPSEYMKSTKSEVVQLEEEVKRDIHYKLSRIVNQIMVKGKFDFINIYLEQGKEISLFVNELNKVWPEIFKLINEKKKMLYAIESVYNTEFSYLEQINVDNILSSYISRQSDFLYTQNPDVERFEKALKLLNVKFKAIDYQWSNEELFMAVYKHNLYEINLDMICLMLKTIYGYDNEDVLVHKNYTLILSKPEEPLTSYVKENIDDYINVIVNKCDYINDSEEVVIQLLNDDVDSVLKEMYIEKLKTKISSIKAIEHIDLWKTLIINNLIYSDSNVLEYYFNSGNEIDKVIADYINNHITKDCNFNYKQIENEYGEDSGSKFMDDVVRSKDISIKAHTYILIALKMVYNKFDIEGISDDKMDVLINLKMIKMTSENLEFIRVHYTHKVAVFIKQNIQIYVQEIINKENLNLDELKEVLGMDVSEEFKFALLKLTTHPVTCLPDYYSEELTSYILHNNFDKDELPELFGRYMDLSDNLKNRVEEITILNLNHVTSNEFIVPFQLGIKLFDTKSISQDIKFSIFASSASTFSLDECQESLQKMKQNNLLSILKGKRTALPITSINKTILDIFEQNNWIHGYGVDKKDNNIYRVKKLSSHQQQRQQDLEMHLY